MQDYAGVDVRSETLLRAGFKYLTDLKDKVQTRITADHSHTLMRCLEVLDLIQCGEIVFLAALFKGGDVGSSATCLSHP